MSTSETTAIPDTNRQDWLRLMALSDMRVLADIWDGLPAQPETMFLRHPEIGLAMVRGRAGGSGMPFNLGEMTVTRCVVTACDTLSGARIDGVGYTAGRDRDKAALVARLDAALQDSACDDALRTEVIDRLQADRAGKLDNAAAKTAATRVEFFTMERGRG